MPVKIKRVYEEPESSDGERILVDRIWPRGLTKEKAKIDLWLKDIAPSGGLRKAFGHDPSKWQDFKEKYISEIRRNGQILNMLEEKARHGTVTLVYAAKDTAHNNAVVLKELLG